MFQFPQPGERTNGASLQLEQVEVCALLSLTAMALAVTECPDDLDGDCENCNETRRLFWDISNSLDQHWRLAYQAHLATMGVPLPEAPWEDVDPQGNPT